MSPFEFVSERLVAMSLAVSVLVQGRAWDGYDASDLQSVYGKEWQRSGREGGREPDEMRAVMVG